MNRRQQGNLEPVTEGSCSAPRTGNKKKEARGKEKEKGERGN